MIIYKPVITIKFKSYYIDPFRPLFNIIARVKLFVAEIKLRRKWKKLNWDEPYIWSKTRYCGSLNDAIQELVWVLLGYPGDNRLRPLAWTLIEEGFERDWK